MKREQNEMGTKCNGNKNERENAIRFVIILLCLESLDFVTLLKILVFK